jgi:hypothetical protein
MLIRLGSRKLIAAGGLALIGLVVASPAPGNAG